MSTTPARTRTRSSHPPQPGAHLLAPVALGRRARHLCGHGRHRRRRLPVERLCHRRASGPGGAHRAGGPAGAPHRRALDDRRGSGGRFRPRLRLVRILARVDFLLVAEPLPILLSALQLPAAIIMLAALVMSLGVWRLEAGESLLFSPSQPCSPRPGSRSWCPTPAARCSRASHVFAIAALLLVGALGPWVLLGAGAWAADQGLDPRAAQAAMAVAAGVVVGLLATEASSRPVLWSSRSCPAASASPSATASTCRTAPRGSGRSWRRTRASPWPGRPMARGS